MTPAGDRGLPVRRIALEALARVEDDGAYSTHVVPQLVDPLPDQRDRRLASHLAYDTLRWRGTLDWMLAQVLTRPMDEVEVPLQRILRLGALQLWRTRVPDRAAVATAVDLARAAVPARRATGATTFVNGVLRNLARRLDQLPWPDPHDDVANHLILTTGHPGWIVDDLLARHAPALAMAILTADNEPPGLTLRAIADRDELLAELQASGLAALPTAEAPEGIRVPGADPRRLPAVAEGRAIPQDEASMLVARMTGISAGDRVIDLCAGPGGKTSHLRALTGPDGAVTAVEVHPHRAARIRDVLGRLGQRVDVVIGDARTVELPEQVDAVLVDAPCTGLGVGRRRPEVRWRRTPQDVQSLSQLQLQLLRRAAELVRPDGRLTYAVCTWTAGETTAVTDQIEQEFAGRLEREAQRQMLPHEGTDGMYVVRWRILSA